MATRYRPTFLAVLLAWVIPMHAQCVQLGEAGVGEVLVFPFFNTEMGWDTYLELTLDGGDTPQIIKIHVRDDINGDIINSFNLYQWFGPGAIRGAVYNWRAAITKDSQGNPVLRVAEGPCTISNEGVGGEAGSSFPLNASVGSIEVYAVSAKLTRELRESIADCDQIVERWEPQGDWHDNPDADLEEVVSGPPSYNISGLATVINVSDGLSASYRPLSFVEFADQIPHTTPSADSPTLADANPVAILPGGQEFTPQSGEGIDAVAYLIGVSSNGLNAIQNNEEFDRDYTGQYAGHITNQVIQSTAIGARTEWVLSYPLSGYKSYRPFEVSVDGEVRQCETVGSSIQDGGSLLIPKHAAVYGPVPVHSDHAWRIIESWGAGNRLKIGVLDISPPGPEPSGSGLCHAVNILGFEDQAAVLIPEKARNLYRLRNEVLWSPENANDSSNPDSVTLRWHIFDPEGSPEIPRPVVGFRLTVFKNGTLNGGSTLANYAILQSHYSH